MHLVKHMLGVATVALLAGSLSAQVRSDPPAATGTTFTVPTPLFQFQGVPQTLNLTPDQIKRLQEWTQKMETSNRDAFKRALNSTAAERNANLQRLRNQFNQDWMKGTNDIFTQAQLRRYQQLQWQLLGPEAFTDPALQKRFNLTEAQLNQLRTLQNRYSTQLQQFGTASPLLQEENLRRWQQLQRDTAGKINGVLTPEQRKMWGQMTGDPFKFPLPPATGTGGTGTRPRR